MLRLKSFKLAVLLVVGLASGVAFAAPTPLPVGGSVPLNTSVDPADYLYAPSGASLLTTGNTSFAGGSGDSAFNGSLNWKVFSGDANNPNSGLTFEYWFFSDNYYATAQTISQFTIDGWLPGLSIAAAIKGGGKEIVPDSVSRDSSGTISWNWIAPDTVGPGGSSAHLFLLTSATGYGNVNGTLGGGSNALITTVGAIPEPEIYAMMGMGLGLLGWFGRRRKLQEAA